MIITGILLAGGRSKRMGEDKAFLRYRGRCLYTYPLEILECFCSRILISSSSEKFKGEKYEIVEDIYKNAGPIGGILSCLKVSETPLNIVMSCDQPLVTREFIYQLLAESEGAQISVGTQKGVIQPLPGVYAKSLIDKMNEMIVSDNYKMRHLIDKVSVKLLDSEEKGFDPARIYRNINSPVDFTELKKDYGE